MPAALEEDLNQQLGTGRASERRGSRDQRNGHCTRRLQTAGGTLCALRVPRSRQGTYRPRVLGRYQRRAAAGKEALCQLFLRGVSTRQGGGLLGLLTGRGVSATTVSPVPRVLNEQVAAFHRRPLSDTYRYLLLDGIWLCCKGAQASRKVVVLVAYGLTARGGGRSLTFARRAARTKRRGAAFCPASTRGGWSAITWR